MIGVDCLELCDSGLCTSGMTTSFTGFGGFPWIQSLAWRTRQAANLFGPIRIIYGPSNNGLIHLPGPAQNHLLQCSLPILSLSTVLPPLSLSPPYIHLFAASLSLYYRSSELFRRPVVDCGLPVKIAETSSSLVDDGSHRSASPLQYSPLHLPL